MITSISPERPDLSSVSMPNITAMDSTWTEAYGETELVWQTVVAAKSWYPFIIVLMYVVIVGAIPGNVLTILAFIKYPALRTPTNYLICNQSCADLLFVVTSQLFIWFNYTSAGLAFIGQHKYACVMSLWCALGPMLLSLVNMFLLSSERLLAVVWSLRYFSWVTERSVCLAIGVSWCLVILINSLPLLGWNVWQFGHNCMTMEVYPSIYYLFLYMLPSLLMLILTAVFNIIIAIIAAAKNRIAPVSQDSACAKSSQAASYKITRMLLTVVGVFYLSWMPYLVMTVVYFLAKAWKTQSPPEWFLLLHEVSKSLLGLNGICNPFIYARKNIKFRIAYRRLLNQPLSEDVTDEIA